MRSIILFFFFFSSAAVICQTRTEQAHSKVRIIVDKKVVALGDELRVGLYFELEDHWHTYWKNPGDSGAAPLIQLTSVPEIQSSDLFYPLPHRLKTGPLTSYVYEKENLLFYKLRLPESLEPKPELLRVDLSAEWLVCKEECIPAFYDFSISIPLAMHSAPSDSAQLFDRFESSISEEQLLIDAVEDAETLALDFSGLKSRTVIDVLPFPESGLSNDTPSILAEGGKLSVILNKNGPLADTDHHVLVITGKDGGGLQGSVGALIPGKTSSSLLLMLVSSFLGGLILNLMPCVFPILTLKIFSFVKASQGDRKDVIVSQLAYVLGILLSFWLIAFTLFFIRLSGEAVGWGFQMQNPWFIAFLALLFFVLGLNFAGYWAYTGYGSGIGQSLTQKKGLVGSFFTGVLAVVVASPCTAPFMGAALGYALGQNLSVILAIFTALGLGLGAPYLILALIPQLGEKLPRPGPWMESLKEYMAFPMWGTSIWLISILQSQIDSTGIIAIMISSLLIVLGIRLGRGKSLVLRFILGTLLALGLGFILHSSMVPKQNKNFKEDKFWLEYSPEELNTRIGKDGGVFINFTAVWCISCQVNDRTTFQNDAVRSYVKEQGIVMMKADWTNRDPEISEILGRYQRAGVPLYLYYPPFSKQARILPEILSPDIFLNHVSK